MNNLLTEGRYDKVTSELTKELARAVMQGKKRLQTRIVVLKRTFVDISVYFKYQEEWDWQSFPLVYGGTYGNPKEIRKNFKNTRIVLHIEVPKDLDYRKEEMAMLVPEMKNIIRHEIEHVLQQRLTDRQREGFFSKHRRYPQDIEYWEYFVEPYEVEAYVRGLYKKARTLQQPLNVLFDEFWKYFQGVGVHPDEIAEIKKQWTAYALKHLPQTPTRKFGYRDENLPPVEPTTPEITESQRVMGFKLKSMGPKVNCIINFEAPDAGNIKFKLRDLLDDLSVDVNSVLGGGGRYNSYSLDLNLYDEKEARSIVNDLTLKLMLSNIRISDVTIKFKEPKINEAIDHDLKIEVGGKVRMSDEYRKNMSITGLAAHVDRYGDRIGEVIDIKDNDVAVKWEDSNKGNFVKMNFWYKMDDLVPYENYADYYMPEIFDI